MREYASIILLIIEYVSIYLKKKQSAEYATIMNVSDAAHSKRSLYKLVRRYRDRGVFRTLSNI